MTESDRVAQWMKWTAAAGWGVDAVYKKLVQKVVGKQRVDARIFDENSSNRPVPRVESMPLSLAGLEFALDALVSNIRSLTDYDTSLTVSDPSETLADELQSEHVFDEVKNEYLCYDAWPHVPDHLQRHTAPAYTDNDEKVFDHSNNKSSPQLPRQQIAGRTLEIYPINSICENRSIDTIVKLCSEISLSTTESFEKIEWENQNQSLPSSDVAITHFSLKKGWLRDWAIISKKLSELKKDRNLSQRQLSRLHTAIQTVEKLCRGRFRESLGFREVPEKASDALDGNSRRGSKSIGSASFEKSSSSSSGRQTNAKRSVNERDDNTESNPDGRKKLRSTEQSSLGKIKLACYEAKAKMHMMQKGTMQYADIPCLTKYWTSEKSYRDHVESYHIKPVECTADPSECSYRCTNNKQLKTHLKAKHGRDVDSKKLPKKEARKFGKSWAEIFVHFYKNWRIEYGSLPESNLDLEEIYQYCVARLEYENRPSSSSSLSEDQQELRIKLLTLMNYVLSLMANTDSDTRLSNSSHNSNNLPSIPKDCQIYTEGNMGETSVSPMLERGIPLCQSLGSYSAPTLPAMDCTPGPLTSSNLPATPGWPSQCLDPSWAGTSLTSINNDDADASSLIALTENNECAMVINSHFEDATWSSVYAQRNIDPSSTLQDNQPSLLASTGPKHQSTIVVYPDKQFLANAGDPLSYPVPIGIINFQDIFWDFQQWVARTYAVPLNITPTFFYEKFGKSSAPLRNGEDLEKAVRSRVSRSGRFDLDVSIEAPKAVE